MAKITESDVALLVDKVAELQDTIAELRNQFTEARRYMRHLRGCEIMPDSPIMRALTPRGVPFVARPCSCGLDKLRRVMEG
jgi:hypothetical protein